MTFTKQSQIKKTLPTKKVCSECKRNRDLKFFSSKRAIKCTECKKRGWKKALANSPGKINKTRDANWSYMVKELAGNKCEYCGKTENLNSHHIYSRSNHAVRWCLENGVCLCAGHHTLKSDFSAHKTPVEFIEWIRGKRGDQWYELLKVQARSVKGQNG